VLTAEPEAGEPAEFPRLVPGISSWPFFPEKVAPDGRRLAEGVSIVGSLALDRYITVPNPKLPAIEKAVRAVQESRSWAEAEERLRRLGFAVDLEELCGKLRSTGLVLGPDGVPVAADSDLERNFVRVGSVSLRRAAPFFAWVGRNFLAILALVVALAAVLWLRGAHLAPARLATPHARELSFAGFWRHFALLAGSFFLHELCHGVTAARFGLPPRKFEVGFYLGFLPTFFLRVGGLYTLPPRRRVAVWAAGSAGNFLLATGAAVAMACGAGSGGWLGRILWLNLMLGLFNLVPFLPTDGYFIASTLLRRSNLRRRAWTSIQSFRQGGERPSPVLWVYVVGSSILIALLLLSRLVWIIRGFSVNPTYSIVRLALILFFTGVVVARRKRRSVQERTARNGR
jgi:putative peptide zinc metalloprotease protein